MLSKRCTKCESVVALGPEVWKSILSNSFQVGAALASVGQNVY